MSDLQPTDQHSQNTRQDISREIVHLLKQFYGKGPERAKTIYSEDVVLVVLRGGYTAVEQTLLDSGRGAAVIEQRMAFQEAMADRFREVVERHTGRKVIAFMSGSHQEPDLIAEMFVLEQRGPSDLLHSF